MANIPIPTSIITPATNSKKNFHGIIYLSAKTGGIQENSIFCTCLYNPLSFPICLPSNVIDKPLCYLIEYYTCHEVQYYGNAHEPI